MNKKAFTTQEEMFHHYGVTAATLNSRRRLKVGISFSAQATLCKHYRISVEAFRGCR
jgi:hypothetical protein